MLQDTVERVYVGDAYGDIERGIFLIRGENVVLLGEIVGQAPRVCALTACGQDAVKEAAAGLRQLPVEDILELQQADIIKQQEQARRQHSSHITHHTSLIACRRRCA